MTSGTGRRGLLVGSVAALAAPALAAPVLHGQPARVLKFVPQSDLSVLDPLATTACVTRNHAYLVFDTLFGQDAQYRPTLQMLEAAGAEEDGRVWRLRLRPGLLFHDDQPVLARDCVASLRRWMARDAFGDALAAATDDLSAADDRTIVFRLKRPFPLLPDALGKTPTLMPAMMPERLARTDPFIALGEMVGSGPFRFLPNERIPGARIAYERFVGYRPREDGTAAWTAGPKIANFDRIEWVVLSDDAIAAAALQTGEVDWWEDPTIDLVPALAANPRLRVHVPDPTGSMCVMRLNHLQPPFDNPATRRALLGAVDQREFMTAVAGTDPQLWRGGVGFFCPGMPMASDAGIEVLRGPRDLARVRRDLREAGYARETTAILSASDVASRKALAEVGAGMFRKVGMNVVDQPVEATAVLQRRENKGPVARGGWSATITSLSGLAMSTPAGHALRTTGETAWFGWPSSERIEALRQQWLMAPDLATQQRICAGIQRQAWIDVPQIPLGVYYQPTAFKADLTGMLDGFPIFWNIRRA